VHLTPRNVDATPGPRSSSSQEILGRVGELKALGREICEL
jgi:hypothetical protein